MRLVQRCRAAALAAGGALLWLATPSAAAPRPQNSVPAALAALQELDARVASVGWRLARGNVRFCRDAVPAVGLQLQDLANYAEPAAIRAALRLPGDIAVQATASGSPAGRAGLAANDPIIEVAGQPVADLPRAKPGDYARLAGLHDRIDAALRASGKVSLVRLHQGAAQRLEIAGEPVCPTRFELLSGGERASADGSRVVIGRKLVERLADDQLLAAALAHELAHNLLGHRAWLNAQGRTWGKIRTTEREADRLSVWLLANAGYPPEAAVRFFERWGPANDHGILAEPTHDGWKARIRRISAELAALRAASAGSSDGAADWPRGFRPERIDGSGASRLAPTRGATPRP